MIMDIPVIPGSPRNPAADCTNCGRRGTFARVRRATDPPTEGVYCRRCWPGAHLKLAAERDADIAEWLRVTQSVALDLTPPPPTTMQWHWSLAPGTIWREFWR
jgi:hypothetical protein